jgi:hypothetical protein
MHWNDVYIPVKLKRSRLPVVDVAERHDPRQLGIFAPLLLRRPPIDPRLHLVPRVGRVHVDSRDDTRVVKRQAEACQPGPASKGSSISSSSSRIWRCGELLTRRSSSARNMARRRPWSTASNPAAGLRAKQDQSSLACEACPKQTHKDLRARICAAARSARSLRWTAACPSIRIDRSILGTCAQSIACVRIIRGDRRRLTGRS